MALCAGWAFAFERASGAVVVMMSMMYGVFVNRGSAGTSGNKSCTSHV